MQRLFGRTITLAASLALLMSVCGAVHAQSYKLSNLVSNQTGKAKHTDALLVNAWGLAYGGGSAIWVSDEGTGWSTLYDGTGTKQSLEVIIPKANGQIGGTPTGIVYNGSSEFNVKNWPSIFLFVTLDGSIQGWSPISNPNEAIVAVNNSTSGAVYTGLAVSTHTSGNFLFAADNANNKVDIYNGTFAFVKSFTDTTLTGMSPFGIQDINGQVYVAFASVSGGPGGVIDIFDEDGTFVKHLTRGMPLNQPWGMTVAPSNFGPLSNTLLVSNNINTKGTINGFDLTTGAFVGTVMNAAGKAIAIDQLWGIEFGGGSSMNGKTNELFFTAGPNNNVNGTFGAIEFK